jgi:hypothetical protein
MLNDLVFGGGKGESERITIGKEEHMLTGRGCRRGGVLTP